MTVGNRQRGVFSLLLPVLVAVLAGGLYLNTLGNEFVFDDLIAIVQNPLIRDLRNLPTIFHTDYWRDPERGLYYRPLPVASFALNYALGELNPFGYHLGNLLLHAGVTLLVYPLALLLHLDLPGAVIAALIFAVHPLNTEAVAAVVGRTDLLASLFFLLSLLLYLRRDRLLSPAKGWAPPLSLTAYLLALLSKENAITLPAILFATDLFHPDTTSRRGLLRRTCDLLRERGIRLYLPYVGVAALYLGIRSRVLDGLHLPSPSFLENPLAHTDAGTRLLTALVIVAKYLGLFIFPLSLSADYSYNAIPLITSVADPRFLTATLALGLLLLLMVAGRTLPSVPFGVLFFCLTLFPVANLLFPIGTIMAERLLYLPSFGLSLVVGAAFSWGLRSLRSKALFGLTPKSLFLLFGLGLFLLCVRTVLRNRDWRDQFTLFQSALAVSPGSAKVHNNLGVHYGMKGRLAEAQREFEEAIKILPRYPEALFNLGLIYRRRGLLLQAEQAYRAAIQTKPNFPEAHQNLGVLYQLQGRLEEAEVELQEAERLRKRR